jgi:hypothetical protein
LKLNLETKCLCYKREFFKIGTRLVLIKSIFSLKCWFFESFWSFPNFFLLKCKTNISSGRLTTFKLFFYFATQHQDMCTLLEKRIAISCISDFVSLCCPTILGKQNRSGVKPKRSNRALSVCFFRLSGKHRDERGLEYTQRDTKSLDCHCAACFMSASAHKVSLSPPLNARRYALS